VSVSLAGRLHQNLSYLAATVLVVQEQMDSVPVLPADCQVFSSDPATATATAMRFARMS
jgi:hypothetical protein